MKKTKIPTISKEQAEAFTENAASLVSVGYKNIMWADEVGIPVVLGYESLRDWVTDKVGGYVRYPIEERREIAKELRANGKSKSAIGEILGVDDDTIANDLAAKGEPPRKRKHSENRNSAAKAKEPKTPKAGVKTEGPPPGWHTGVPSNEVIQAEADDGFRAIVWDKVKDRLEPVLIEVLGLLDEDEIPYLIDAIQYAIDAIQP